MMMSFYTTAVLLALVHMYLVHQQVVAKKSKVFVGWREAGGIIQPRSSQDIWHINDSLTTSPALAINCTGFCKGYVKVHICTRQPKAIIYKNYVDFSNATQIGLPIEVCPLCRHLDHLPQSQKDKKLLLSIWQCFPGCGLRISYNIDLKCTDFSLSCNTALLVKSSNSNNAVANIFIALASVVVVLSGGLVIVCCRYHRVDVLLRNVSRRQTCPELQCPPSQQSNVTPHSFGSYASCTHNLQKTTTNETPLKPAELLEVVKESRSKWLLSLSHLLVDSSRVNVEQSIVEGSFSSVNAGVLLWTNSDEEMEKKHVTIKYLTCFCSSSDIPLFMKDITLLDGVPSHANITQLLAVCIDDSKPALACLDAIIQYNLKHYVSQRYKEEKPLTDLEQINYSLQIIRGCCHLQEQNLVHKDISARNCWLTKDNVVKISCSTGSRDIFADDYVDLKKQFRLPIRWLAVESLVEGKYTHASDVWSSGVLMWELTTHCSVVPYDHLENEDLEDFLQEGYRLERAEGCSDKFFGIMWQCWNSSPAHRPKFSHLCGKLQSLRKLATETEAALQTYSSVPGGGVAGVGRTGSDNRSTSSRAESLRYGRSIRMNQRLASFTESIGSDQYTATSMVVETLGVTPSPSYHGHSEYFAPEPSSSSHQAAYASLKARQRPKGPHGGGHSIPMWGRPVLGHQTSISPSHDDVDVPFCSTPIDDTISRVTSVTTDTSVSVLHSSRNPLYATHREVKRAQQESTARDRVMSDPMRQETPGGEGPVSKCDMKPPRIVQRRRNTSLCADSTSTRASLSFDLDDSWSIGRTPPSSTGFTDSCNAASWMSSARNTAHSYGPTNSHTSSVSAMGAATTSFPTIAPSRPPKPGQALHDKYCHTAIGKAGITDNPPLPARDKPRRDSAASSSSVAMEPVFLGDKCATIGYQNISVTDGAAVDTSATAMLPPTAIADMTATSGTMTFEEQEYAVMDPAKAYSELKRVEKTEKEEESGEEYTVMGPSPDMAEGDSNPSPSDRGHGENPSKTCHYQPEVEPVYAKVRQGRKRQAYPGTKATSRLTSKRGRNAPMPAGDKQAPVRVRVRSNPVDIPNAKH